MIWAAVNPPTSDDDTTTYQTEEFDPAQEDRFHVIYTLPYKPDLSYFSSKYGAEKAKIAINWWNALSTEQKNSVSPRRLDLALQYVDMKGDLRDILPKTVNITNLISQLMNGSYKEKLDECLRNLKNSGDYSELKSFLANNNVINELESELKKPNIIKTVAKALSPEMLFKFLSQTNSFDAFIENTSFDEYKDIHIKIYKTATIKPKNKARIEEHMKNIKNKQIASIQNPDVVNAIKTFEVLYNDAISYGTTPYRMKAINYILTTNDFNYDLEDVSANIIATMLTPLLVSTQKHTFSKLAVSDNTAKLRIKQLTPYISSILDNTYSKNVRDRVMGFLDK